MFQKFLLSILLLGFAFACTTTPKDTADSSGSGSSGEFNTATTDSESSDDSVAATTSDYDGIISGSQEDLVVNIGDRVYFAYDSFELDEDAKELLQHQAAWLKQYNKTSIIIEGHCDERGTREYNLALGEKRAQAVKNYLSGLGVINWRLNTISYGKERPAVVGSTDAAWSQNRRSVTTVN